MEYQGHNPRPNGNIGNSGKPDFEAYYWTSGPVDKLNEGMQQMSIRSTDSGSRLEISSDPYPERPDVADCAIYISTGSCRFGMNCLFNHPPNRKQVCQTGDPTNKAGQSECEFYLKGTCKYGATCKYVHSNQKEGSREGREFNFLGLPIRQGEKECPFYMRTGSCKYAVTCKYHHPEPGSETAAASVSSSPSRDKLAASAETSCGSVNPSWPLPQAPYFPLPQAPYSPLPRSSLASSIRPEEYGSHRHPIYPSQQVSSSVPEWNNYQAPVSGYPSLEGKQHPNGVGLMNMPKEGQYFSGTHVPDPRSLSSSGVRPCSMQSPRTDAERDVFPERPGQPECQHFLKTGHCKFGATCKFHHPKRTEQRASVNGFPSLEGKQHPDGVGLMNMQSNGQSLSGTHVPDPRSLSSSGVRPSGLQSTRTDSERDVFPERPGQPECQHFLKTGHCKFGATCKFHHPKRTEQSAPVSGFPSLEGKQHPDGVGLMNMQRNGQSLSGTHVPDPRPLSSSGVRPFSLQSTRTDAERDVFPERPGQPECQHFMKTGLCKFGATCKFHHPKRTEQCRPKISLLSSEKKQNLIGIDFENYVKQLNGQATTAQESVYLASKPEPFSSNAQAVQLQSAIQNCRFPERPGQPECSYYMKTGDCHFGDNCLYHHPRERIEQSPESMLNPTTLPGNYVHASPFSLKEEMQDKSIRNNSNAIKHLYNKHALYATMDGFIAQHPEFSRQMEIYPERPGQPECQYYKKTGVCKSGTTCGYPLPKDGSEIVSTSKPDFPNSNP